MISQAIFSLSPQKFWACLCNFESLLLSINTLRPFTSVTINQMVPQPMQEIENSLLRSPVTKTLQSFNIHVDKVRERVRFACLACNTLLSTMLFVTQKSETSGVEGNISVHAAVPENSRLHTRQEQTKPLAGSQGSCIEFPMQNKPPQ